MTHNQLHATSLWNYVNLFICFTSVLLLSGDKLVNLYKELQASESAPHLISHFEDVISALMSDVRKVDESKKKMEEKIKR